MHGKTFYLKKETNDLTDVINFDDEVVRNKKNKNARHSGHHLDKKNC